MVKVKFRILNSREAFKIWSCACPPKRNGKKPRAAQMDANILGEIPLIKTNAIQAKAEKAIQPPLVCIPRKAIRPMAARIWQAMFGNGHTANTRHILTMLTMGARMNKKTSAVFCAAVPSAMKLTSPVAPFATGSVLAARAGPSVFEL